MGTYVDTVTVTAREEPSVRPGPFSTACRITAAPVPVVLAVSPGTRNASAQQGTLAPSDNATVTLTGDNASSTTWTATKKKSWTTLTVASGTGSGTVSWSRSTSGLTAGTYVDTIAITAPGAASGSPATVIDTLKITTAPVPLTVTLNTASRHVAAQQGATVASDYFAVTLTGSNAATATWSAVKTASWATFTNSGATGTGSVLWTRSTADSRSAPMSTPSR